MIGLEFQKNSGNSDYVYYDVDVTLLGWKYITDVVFTDVVNEIQGLAVTLYPNKFLIFTFKNAGIPIIEYYVSVQSTLPNNSSLLNPSDIKRLTNIDTNYEGIIKMDFPTLYKPTQTGVLQDVSYPFDVASNFATSVISLWKPPYGQGFTPFDKEMIYNSTTNKFINNFIEGQTNDWIIDLEYSGKQASTIGSVDVVLAIASTAIIYPIKVYVDENKLFDRYRVVIKNVQISSLIAEGFDIMIVPTFTDNTIEFKLNNVTRVSNAVDVQEVNITTAINIT